MREITSSVTSKGQVTLPVEIRRLLNIGDRGKVTFVIDDDETIRLRVPAYPDVASLVGNVTSRDPSLSWDEVLDIARSEVLQQKMRRSG